MKKIVKVIDRIIDDEILTVTPSLAAALGINEAHIVQQINYWTKVAAKGRQEFNHRDGFFWVYKTAEQWAVEFPWLSSQAIARYLRALRGAGILVATDKFNYKTSDRTLWYRVNLTAEIEIEEPKKRRKKKEKPPIKM